MLHHFYLQVKEIQNSQARHNKSYLLFYRKVVSADSSGLQRTQRRSYADVTASKTPTSKQPPKPTNINNHFSTTNVNQPHGTVNKPPATINESPATINKPPATINNPLATVNKSPATINEPPATINNPPATVNKTPATINESSANINEPPATINKSPATINEPPATINEPPATINNPPATINKSPATINEPPATINEPSATINKPTATVNKSPVTINEPPATVNKPPATINKSPATVNEMAATINQQPATINQPLNDLHISLTLDETFDINQYYSKIDYTCKLCEQLKVYSRKKWKIHFQAVHEKKSVYIINHGIRSLACKLNCFGCIKSSTRNMHYHCICQKIYSRRCDFLSHLCRVHKLKIYEKNVNKSNFNSSDNNDIYYSENEIDPNRVKCLQCEMILLKKNYKVHMLRKHSERSNEFNDIKSHPGICVDTKNGIFLISKTLRGVRHPLHVQYKVSTNNQSLICTDSMCSSVNRMAGISNDTSYSCVHLKSAPFAEKFLRQEDINDSILDAMVKTYNILSENRKNEIINLHEKAIQNSSSLIFKWKIDTLSESERYVFYSVYTGEKHYYSKLERVVVTHDIDTDKWLCRCSESRINCIHRLIAKCYLQQTQMKDNFTIITSDTKEDTYSSREPNNKSRPAISDTKTIENYAEYLSKKEIPVEIPQEVLRIDTSTITEIIPSETECHLCNSQTLLLQLVNNNAEMITRNISKKGILVYEKKCLSCNITYRLVHQYITLVIILVVILRLILIFFHG